MAEFIAVIGVIGSIIAIVDKVTGIVKTAKDVDGLPETFRLAFEKLPIISDTLSTTKTTLEANKASEVPKSVADTVERCKARVVALEILLNKVMPSDKASMLKRYYKAVTAALSGKEGKVEVLIKAMLEDILLLASFKTMAMLGTEEVIRTITVMTESQTDVRSLFSRLYFEEAGADSSRELQRITKAITEVEALPPSVPDEEFPAGSGGSHTFTNYGGEMYNAPGGNMTNFKDSSKQFGDSSRQIVMGSGDAIFHESKN